MEQIAENITPEILMAVDPWYWADTNAIKLQAAPFSFIGHEYQREPMQSQARKRVGKKAAQMGWTEMEVLKTLHGLIQGTYPLGALYLFPTQDDVSEFSKARFSPLISDNPNIIGQYVKDTDAVNIKRIGSGILYLRGARVTQMIEGLKKESAKLSSIPVDKVVFDEKDLMQHEMITLATERMGHSEVKEEVAISTPTIPDFGIDKDYVESDQGVWMIKCQHCRKETCLELEFPDCLKNDKNGVIYRACKHCGCKINPGDGHWVHLYPDRDVAGWWISQLNSLYIDPGEILELYHNPPDGNLQEIMNSKLGMAYVAAENKLTKQDIYTCCGYEPILGSHEGPCAMGVDVGKMLHIVIGYKKSEKTRRIVYLGRVSQFEDVHDLAKHFNVKSAVIDMEPETRKAREFQRSENYPIFLCDYQERQKVSERINEQEGVITVKRTEICDATHNEIINESIELPRRCPEVEQYATEMSNIAKVLQEDSVTGSRIYHYRKLGEDHYRHTTNYFHIACKGIEIHSSDPMQMIQAQKQDERDNVLDPFIQAAA